MLIGVRVLEWCLVEMVVLVVEHLCSEWELWPRCSGAWRMMTIHYVFIGWIEYASFTASHTSLLFHREENPPVIVHVVNQSWNDWVIFQPSVLCTFSLFLWELVHLIGSLFRVCHFRTSWQMDAIVENLFHSACDSNGKVRTVGLSTPWLYGVLSSGVEVCSLVAILVAGLYFVI